MKQTLTRKNLIIKKSSIHGYGVFAAEKISPGEIIEECYAIPLGQAGLIHFRFSGGNSDVIPLGYGAIFNHANIPNAIYNYDLEHQILIFKAREEIKPGDEIFIHYGNEWFYSRDAYPLRPSLLYRLRHAWPMFKIVMRFGIVLTCLYGYLYFAPLFLHANA